MQPTIDSQNRLVLYTQKTFRNILDSMARPGKILHLERFPLSDEAVPDHQACLTGLGFTLFDVEVSFYINNPASFGNLSSDLIFHTHSRLEPLEEANFIFLTAADEPELLSRVKRGNLEYPDCGSTVIVSIDYLSVEQSAPGPGGLELHLKGPGILDETVLYTGGITPDHLRVLAEVNAEYPLGIDLILVSGTQFTCLPRLVTIDARRKG